MSTTEESCSVGWEEEDEPELNDEEYEYVTDLVPFVARFKQEMTTRFPGSICYFLGPQHFKELTLPSFETCNNLLNPSVQQVGSMARYFARVTLTDGRKEYFLIKQVRSVENGNNEVKIGAAIGQIGRNNLLVQSHTVPAMFGYEERLLQSDTSTVYFVVVPWLLNTISLDSFIWNEKLLDLSLSTKDTLCMLAPILIVLLSLWKEYKFAYLDAKLDQIIIDASVQPPRLRLVDFGLSTIDGVVEGAPVCVEATKISSSRSFLDCFCVFLDDLHLAVKVNSPNKNLELVKEWVTQKRLLREQKRTTLQFQAWLESVIA